MKIYIIIEKLIWHVVKENKSYLIKNKDNQWRIQGGVVGAIPPLVGWSDKIDFFHQFSAKYIVK